MKKWSFKGINHRFENYLSLVFLKALVYALSVKLLVFALCGYQNTNIKQFPSFKNVIKEYGAFQNSFQ